MSIDPDQNTLCKHCLFRGLITDRTSADVICVRCACVWGTWSPEHPDNGREPPPSYTRDGYFEVVLGNLLGYECKRFTARDLARIRSQRPHEREWDVGKVRSITRKLKLKHLTKSAGRIAHALRFGLEARYPTLHHVEMESMRNMFSHVWSTFDCIVDKKRKNLISYAFVLGKLMEIVGRKEDFAHLIVPIKTASKERFAEAVWREVLKNAPWEMRTDRYDNFKCSDYVSRLSSKSASNENQARASVSVISS